MKFELKFFQQASKSAGVPAGSILALEETVGLRMVGDFHPSMVPSQLLARDANTPVPFVPA